jgi:hypothetical protein
MTVLFAEIVQCSLFNMHIHHGRFYLLFIVILRYFIEMCRTVGYTFILLIL